MKRIKDLMLISSVILILGAIVFGSCTAQTPTDYLKLKGKILAEHKADINLYIQSNETAEWIRIACKYDKSKYNLRLSPQHNYQVFFSSTAGPTKVLHIKSGESGMWIANIDIDFENSSEKNAYIYQEEDIYVLQTKIEYYKTACLE